MLEEARAEKKVSMPDGNEFKQPTIAVLIPCYNEEMTVASVIEQFRAQLPDADIYVFDNNSSDQTVQEAQRAGAIVAYETRQGKGYVVQSMFRQVEADIYVLVDGDGTYPAEAVHRLTESILNDEADMVVGSRLHGQSQSELKSVNRFGNRTVLSVLNFIFKVKLTDILSGYRVFNRQFVKNLPLFAGGFEIETELTIKALEQHYRIVEVPINLSTRPEGSNSKIRIFNDGFRILSTIFTLFRDYKPLAFFTAAGLLLVGAGFIPGVIVILEFIRTHKILRMPSAILAVGLVLSGMLLLMVALILNTVVRRFQELDHQLRILSEDLRRNKN
jgi:glycosyltransferase involved in cell wall biosynthesis